MPALYLAVIVAMAVATCWFRPGPSFANLAVMASGLPFYYFWRKRK